jgi:hypothetical protein
VGWKCGQNRGTENAKRIMVRKTSENVHIKEREVDWKITFRRIL